MPIRSAGYHHRIATFALLALRFPYIRILSIAVAILRHFMLSPPQSRRAALCCRSAATATLFVLIVAPLDDDLPKRRLCHTAPSRCVSPRLSSAAALRPCRRCVTRHPTRYRLIATPVHRAAAAARSFSKPLRYRSRLGLKFYLGDVSSTDHFAFKFYRLNFAQNRDRAPSTDLQAARRAVVPAAADCVYGSEHIRMRASAPM